MIVQCEKCGTKYRFDEALLEGDGVWVRCSRCKNVFFLEIYEEPATVTPSYRATGVEEEPSLERRAEDREPGFEERQDAAETEPSLKEQRDVPGPGPVFEGPKEEIEERDALLKDLKEDDVRQEFDFGVDIEKNSEKPGSNEMTAENRAGYKGKPAKTEVPVEIEKKRGLSTGKQLVYLFIVLLLGGIYLAFFSDLGKQMSLEKILGMYQKRSEEVGPAQVDFADVRQRVVDNRLIGSIRVIEGTAINQSSYPMTRIKVKGEITDNYTVVLAARESYCGNLLTDDELATLGEEQIQKELLNPQGSDVSNDRIAPTGHIPFMIVFTREPAGVVKAFVTPIGAERLLP